MGATIGSLKKNNIIEILAGGNFKLKENYNYDFFKLAQELINYLGNREIKIEDLPEKFKRELENFLSKKSTTRGIFKIQERREPYYILTELGKQVQEEVKKSGLTGDEVSQLTPAMLKDGSWRKYRFRRYNINLPPPRIVVGKKHPYRQFLDFVKMKMISLGFKEMKGSLVEPEFWNMDALFMPQFHSARDIHDVYFIKNPAYAKYIEEPFLTNVAKTHQNGGDTGSKGWGYKFNKERTKRLILRSQGTVLSIRTLASKPDIPGKYFAIARCFRYDKVDATHAADFFQIEGIVLGENITFKHLLGLLKLFAIEIAKAQEIKFAPAYFPFTEPSVEIHMKHPKLGWMELGGAGIFRPEVTQPMGIKVPVIAWGLGLDRMAMVAMGINDIRNLFSSDLNFIRETKITF